MLRGLGLRLRGTLEPALDDLERALALDPACADARYGRGLVRVALGDRGGPGDLERALEESPVHPLAVEARRALDELRRR